MILLLLDPGENLAEALVSRRRGQPSNRRYPADLRRQAIDIIRARYSDFGPTLAGEKLAELHGLHLSRETLRQWMMGVVEQTARRAVRPDIRVTITQGEQSFAPDLVCEIG